MTEEQLPRREELTEDVKVRKEEPPSLVLYALLLLLAFALIYLAFCLASPDWPGFFLNLATEIIGAVIILALVERKLRDKDIEHIIGKVSNFQSDLYFLFHKQEKNLRDYMDLSSSKYRKLVGEMYNERPALEKEIFTFDKDFALVGEPGSGKTTLLQRFYISLCDGTHTDLSKGNIPVLISAQNIRPSQDLVDTILRRHFDHYSISAKRIATFLKKGRIVLILDGLDELIQAEQLEIIDKIAKFKKKWPDNQIVISCRIDSFNLYKGKFESFDIPPLTPEEISKFWKMFRANRQRKANE